MPSKQVVTKCSKFLSDINDIPNKQKHRSHSFTLEISHLSFIKLGGLETELDICREPAYTGDMSLTLEPSRNKSDMIVVFIEKIKQREKNSN